MLDTETLKQIKKPHVCEICLRHDPMIKDYADDLELQNSLKSYIEKETGNKIEVGDIAKLCDSCYVMVNEVTKSQI